MRKFLLLAILLYGLPVYGQVINANSCSSADVQAAFSSVTNSTNTVNIPSCPAGVGWASQVTLTIPSGNTSLSIIGAGNLSTTGGGDQTVIIDNFLATTPVLSIITNSNPSSFVRLAGITVKGGTSGGHPKADGVVSFFGSSSSIRVDHVHINLTTYTGGSVGSGLEFQGCLAGVTDHSIFDAAYNSTENLLRVYSQGSCGGDTLGLGDFAWTKATGLGTSDFIFVENNTFNNGSGNDCTKGGRYVWRFNTMSTGGAQAGPTTQTHPTGGGLRERGCTVEEIYQNTATAVNNGVNGSGYVFSFFWLSSGTAVVWGNTIGPGNNGAGGTGYRAVVTGHNMRRNNNTYGQVASPAGWGYCGTTQNGAASNWDQNSDVPTGYACIDQPGSGPGQRLINDFPNAQNQVTGTVAWPNQSRVPIYEWLDAYSPVPNNPSNIWFQQDTGVNENRDYYLGTRDNGTPITFDGSLTCATAPHCGVGAGTIASRPATCTTGVAYWATDQGSWNTTLPVNTSGQLYKCTSTNTWTLYYTPFTYPHPLVAAAAAPILTYCTSSLNVGLVPLGLTSNPVPCSMTNTGTANLTTTAITLGNPDFALVSNTCGTPSTINTANPGTGFTLTPGSNCTFSVTFKPSVANGAAESDQIVVTGNQTPNPFAFSLFGTGTGIPAPTSLMFAGHFKTSAGCIPAPSKTMLCFADDCGCWLVSMAGAAFRPFKIPLTGALQ